ncbi:hypothetical protein KIPB_001642, partial [Kipferlia bialata]
LPKPLFFMHHTHKESHKPGSRSTLNYFESQWLVNLIPVLCGNGYKPSDITIIALYKGQMFQIMKDIEALRQRIVDHESTHPSLQVLRCPVESLKEVQIVNLDDFQGQENKVILVSLTRSDRLGFVREKNRVLVTLSRAKEVMIVCGHEFFTQTENKVWHYVSQHFLASGDPLTGMGPGLPIGCTKHLNTLNYSDPKQLSSLTGLALGGCTEQCATRLVCGHICPLTCHGPDHSPESGFKCQHRCAGECDRGHRCRAPCHKCQAAKGCVPCTVAVDTVFPCGHTSSVPCHKCSGICEERIIVTCPTCERKYRQKCSVISQLGLAGACPYPCPEDLPCKHSCPGRCGVCTRKGHAKCKATHHRFLGCGHLCGDTCGHSGACVCKHPCDISTCSHGKCPAPCSHECPRCQAPCSIRCRHKKCTRLCCEECDRLPCDKPCRRRLRCGCVCRGLCGEACPPCPTHDKEAYKGMQSVMDMCPLLEVLEEDPEARVYYMPTCKHSFLVDELDQTIRVREKDIHDNGELTNVALLCPHGDCRERLTLANAPRYQRVVREVAKRLNKAKRLARERERELQAAQQGELTSEEFAEVKRAMIGDVMGAVEGHWFEHDCGCTYFIADCGGATVQSVCPSCGGTLGGRDHTLTEGNKQSHLDAGSHMAWRAMETGPKIKDTLTEREKAERLAKLRGTGEERRRREIEAMTAHVAEAQRHRLQEAIRAADRGEGMSREDFCVINGQPVPDNIGMQPGGGQGGGGGQSAPKQKGKGRGRGRGKGKGRRGSGGKGASREAGTRALGDTQRDQVEGERRRRGRGRRGSSRGGRGPRPPQDGGRGGGRETGRGRGRGRLDHRRREERRE